jgi:hypothetical protein
VRVSVVAPVAESQMFASISSALDGIGGLARSFLQMRAGRRVCRARGQLRGGAPDPGWMVQRLGRRRSSRPPPVVHAHGGEPPIARRDRGHRVAIVPADRHGAGVDHRGPPDRHAALRGARTGSWLSPGPSAGTIEPSASRIGW